MIQWARENGCSDDELEDTSGEESEGESEEEGEAYEEDM